MNYIDEPDSPSICIWSHENSYELELAIEFVAKEFTDFFEMLHD